MALLPEALCTPWCLLSKGATFVFTPAECKVHGGRLMQNNRDQNIDLLKKQLL